MITNYFSYKKYAHGFTLIETLFAVLIFSAALMSLMTIAGRGISAANTAKDQTVAHYLAQEGLEVVRNIRDSNFLSGNPWDDVIANCNESGPCNVDYVSGGAPELSQGDLTMYRDSGTGFFTNLGEESQFTRSIVLQQQNSPDGEYLVTVTVSWNAKGIDRSVVLKTLLENWYGSAL